MANITHNLEKSLADWPPLKLAKLTFAATLLAVTASLAPAVMLLPRWLRIPLIGLHPHLPILFTYGLVSLLIAFTPSLIGIQVIVLVKRQIEIRKEQNRWTEQEKEQARSWLTVRKRYFIALSTAMFLCGLAVTILWRDSALIRTTFSLMACVCAIFTLHNEFTKESREDLQPKSQLKGWSGTIKGIHSEHWGGRQIPKSVSSEAK